MTPGIPIRYGHRKPPPGTPVDWGHPLSQKLVIDCPFNEGAGTQIFNYGVRGAKGANTMFNVIATPPVWIIPNDATYPWGGPALDTYPGSVQADPGYIDCRGIVEARVGADYGGWTWTICFQPMDRANTATSRSMDSNISDPCTAYSPVNSSNAGKFTANTRNAAGTAAQFTSIPFPAALPWIMLFVVVKQANADFYTNTDASGNHLPYLTLQQSITADPLKTSTSSTSAAWHYLNLWGTINGNSGSWSTNPSAPTTNHARSRMGFCKVWGRALSRGELDEAHARPWANYQMPGARFVSYPASAAAAASHGGLTTLGVG